MRPKDKPMAPGTIFLATSNLGFPLVLKVENDGSWVCIYGVFNDRYVSSVMPDIQVLAEGDIIDNDPAWLKVKDGGLQVLDGKPEEDDE